MKTYHLIFFVMGILVVSISCIDSNDPKQTATAEDAAPNNFSPITKTSDDRSFAQVQSDTVHAVKSDSVAIMEDCVVGLIRDVLVPAHDTGPIKVIGYKDEEKGIEYVIKEGAMVKKDDVIAMLDNRRALMTKKAAELALDRIKAEAENDVNIRFSMKSHAVAIKEHQKAKEANQNVKGTFPAVELARLKLSEEKAELEIEQSKFKQKLLELDKATEGVKLKGAEDELRRRKIFAPLSGMVVKVMAHKGEWVEAGTPVFRIIQVDKLRVRGYLSLDDYHPSQIRGKKVEVTVTLTGGKKITITGGDISFVSPLLSAGNEYRVWAEVDNKKGLLRPGMEASMKVLLK